MLVTRKEFDEYYQNGRLQYKNHRDYDGEGSQMIKLKNGLILEKEKIVHSVTDFHEIEKNQIIIHGIKKQGLGEITIERFWWDSKLLYMVNIKCSWFGCNYETFKNLREAINFIIHRTKYKLGNNNANT